MKIEWCNLQKKTDSILPFLKHWLIIVLLFFILFPMLLYVTTSNDNKGNTNNATLQCPKCGHSNMSVDQIVKKNGKFIVEKFKCTYCDQKYMLVQDNN